MDFRFLNIFFSSKIAINAKHRASLVERFKHVTNFSKEEYVGIAQIHRQRRFDRAKDRLHSGLLSEWGALTDCG